MNLARSFGLTNENWSSTHVSYVFDLSNSDFTNLQHALVNPTNGGNYDIQMDGGGENMTSDGSKKKKKKKKDKKTKTKERQKSKKEKSRKLRKKQNFEEFPGRGKF